MFPVPVGGVLKVEIVRGHDSAVFAFGNEQRIEQGAGHERALGQALHHLQRVKAIGIQCVV